MGWPDAYVTGKGAPVRLDFLSPGGALTGQLLPTGRALDVLDIPELGRVEVSIVDAANLCVFVSAKDVGMTGTELPEALERDIPMLKCLHTIGAQAVVALGVRTVNPHEGTLARFARDLVHRFPGFPQIDVAHLEKSSTGLD